MKHNRQVVVHLYGGVGNQLFQYSFGEYLRNNYELDVLYDISSFGVLATFRDLQITSIAKDIPIYETGKCFFSRHTRFYRRLSRWFFRHKPNTMYVDNEFDEQILKQRWKLLYCDGYWQNYKYPSWIKKRFANIYMPLGDVPQSILDYFTYIKNNNVVSVHIRRGDYINSVNAKHLGVCSLEYYNKAISVVAEMSPNPSFLFFSDDTDWVKQNFDLKYNMLIVENEDIPPYWYIYLMSKCHHNVMSNSTFSWWGNFLNNNLSKITIAPSRWYLDQDNPKLYNEKWILI